MDAPFWLSILFMAIGSGMRIGAMRFIKHPADRSDFINTSNGIIIFAGIIAFVRSWQVNGVIVTIGITMFGFAATVIAAKLLLAWRSRRKRTVSLGK